MIGEIRIAACPWKRNWIDQNKFVFGYDDEVSCCEEWGWGVYNPATRERVADSPTGLPYHFDFSAGAQEFSCWNEGRNDERLAFRDQSVDVLDCVRVSLIPDDGHGGPPLVFEAYTHHNGYYMHDFLFRKEAGNVNS